MGASPAVFIALSRSALTPIAAGNRVRRRCAQHSAILKALACWRMALGYGTDRCAFVLGMLPRGPLPSRQLRDGEHGGGDAEGAGAAGAADLAVLSGKPASRVCVPGPLEGLVQSLTCRRCGMQRIFGVDPYMFRSLGRLLHT